MNSFQENVNNHGLPLSSEFHMPQSASTRNTSVQLSVTAASHFNISHPFLQVLAPKSKGQTQLASVLAL